MDDEYEFQTKGLPVKQHDRHDSLDYELAVDNICNHLRTELMDAKNDQMHVTWLVQSEGVLKTENISARDQNLWTTSTQVQLDDPMSARQLYSRLSSQMFLSGDWIGPTDNPSFELNIGDSENPNFGRMQVNK